MRTTSSSLLSVLAVALAFSNAALSDSPRWREIGPDGGAMRLVALRPGSPDVLIAAVPSPFSSDAAAWVENLVWSGDGGRAWKDLALPPFRDTPWVAFSPTGPRFIYAAGTFLSPAGAFDVGVLRSTDGGGTWNQTGQGRVGPMLVSPGNADVVYRHLFDDSFVQRSTDAGATWHPLAVKGASALAFDSGRPGRLCAVTWEGGGHPWLTCADDPGGTWTHVSELATLPGARILAVDPTTPSSFEVITKTGVARSTDGGATWNVPGGEAFERLDVEWALEPRTATAFAHAWDGSALWRKKQGSLAWETLPIPTLPGCSPEQRAIRGGFLVADDGANLCLVTARGAFVSRDLGDTWTPLPPTGKLPGALALDPTGPASLLLSTDNGPFRSSDGGRSWQRDPAAGTLCGRHDFLATAGGVIYAYDGALLRSTDGGASWSRPGTESFAEPTALSVHPSDPSEVWVAAHEVPQGFPIRQELSAVLPATVLARSTDGGATFSAISFAPDAGQRVIHQVLFDPRDPAVVWAAGQGLFRYRGGTWESLPLPSAPTSTESTISAIAIDAATGTVTVATRGIGVFATRDDGRTWTDVTANLPRSGGRGPAVTALVADPHAPGTLYLSANRVDTLFFLPATHVEGGVFRTTDAGATWERFGEGLGDVSVRRLLLDRRAVPMLYADTVLQAWALPLSAPLRLDRVAPASGSIAGGTLVALSGEGFGAGTRVTVGGAPPQSVELLDARTLRIRTPAHAAGPADVAITNPDGATDSLPGAFRYEEWGACREAGQTLCLEKGRFAVRAARAGAAGHAEPLTTRSGWFWFDWNQIPDAVARVLDGRSVNGRYWIAVSTLTDDPLTLTVTDTVTGRSREYHGAPGQPLAVVDRETFASD
ncbi:MAG: IPT/TIG domain-containing protein [Holophagales bacterium]|nr:IPT/TIG domain-containing protein [Holophagales bacterium]